MTVRKKMEYSVKYNPQSEQTQSVSKERDIKTNTIRNCKQNKNFHKSIKKFLQKYQQKILNLINDE